jgi:hypothetical protein
LLASIRDVERGAGEIDDRDTPVAERAAAGLNTGVQGK